LTEDSPFHILSAITRGKRLPVASIRGQTPRALYGKKHMKKQALGKGLDALIPQEVVVKPSPPSGFVNLRLAEIKRSPLQPRTSFNPEALSELASSIAQKGVIQPIVVRAVEGGYEVVAGERRLRAAELAGRRVVPALIVEATDEEAMQLGLIENIQREDLNPVDRAVALDRLIERFSLSQQDVATRIGKDRASVANYVRILSLPDEVKEYIRQDKLTFGHARAILSLENPAEQRAVARDVVAKGLSVRECERLITKRKSPVRPRQSAPSVLDPLSRAIEEEMQKSLATKVRIVRGRKTGKIEIEFYSDQDLTRILDLLHVRITD
jgi:ParB family transcriptional regulator, chromosome partitioning protein